MKKRFIAGIILVLLTLGSAAGFLFWVSGIAAPMPEALKALESDAQVQVEDRGWWVFTPTQGKPAKGFLFYPGGKVDPRSYAPLMHQIAQSGFLVVLVPMPLNLAIFAPGKADEVMKTFPGDVSWILGGHSLGGASALAFAKDHPQNVKGVVLLASYPPEGLNLSKTNLRILSVYGEKDGLSTPEKITRSQALLPRGTAWVEIKGGNHAQFGWYGPQVGDNMAEISRENQQQTILGALIPFLKSID